ncbi:heme peroxidase [Phellopilus nigrolimitatus]|nr:heme peroxidase [Phellopilus nigrolimitatus]
MLYFRLSLAFFCVLPAFVSCNDPFPAFVNELEHLLVDTGGYNDGGFKTGVTPCSLYNQGAQNLGRQSASQWVRVSFHDVAPANVALGTGGLDASIGFETNREESHGAAMNDSLTFFAPFVNKYASMADMIALGTVVAIGSCSGPLIPYKGGRIDATAAGDYGVPEEFGTLETHLGQFARAGFNHTEMIQLTACGHTIGSVHQNGFPDVVQNAVTPNNTEGGVHLDDTFDVFDNHIATNYIDGKSTDPLVTTPNITVRSDLRIFSSDQNVTMKTLAKSNDDFFAICTRVISKMLNTVPRGVNLIPVGPRPIKPVDVTVAINLDGSMTFSGAIRLLSSRGFPENPSRMVIVSYKYRDGSSSASCSAQAYFNPATTKGSSLYGDTFYHLFSINVDPSRGISAYTVTVYESPVSRAPLAIQSFTIQDSVMWLPELSSMSESNGRVTGTISAAVREMPDQSSVKALIHTPVDQIGAKNPRVVAYPIQLLAQYPLGNSGYILYSSTKDAILPVKNMTTASRSTVDIELVSGSQTFVDDFKKLSILGSLRGP